jgi:hypothetical protein
MDSAMIGKIEKAVRYASQPERIAFSDFQVTLDGDHKEHFVRYTRGDWECDCDYFETRGVCSHTMTMERVLGVMIRPEPVPLAPRVT